jgi:hypothetical protein
MKRLIVPSLIMAGMVLMAGFSIPSYAQSAATDDKPTFYHLVPGTYVSGWPRFTMTYPKDWVEQPPLPQEVFRAGAAAGYGHNPALSVTPAPSPVPLDKVAELWVPFFKAIAEDVTLVSDKPSQLKDGTPAREVEIQMLYNGVPNYLVSLGTMKSGVLVAATVGSDKGRIGEDLKAILYSLQYEPGKDEPVKVPPDIREFLDKYSSDIVSHDLANVMTHYSDSYLRSGEKKGEVERSFKHFIGSLTSYVMSITDFEAEGDKVYLTGFTSINGVRWPMSGTSIIKENGEWKWYGNQREVVSAPPGK